MPNEINFAKYLLEVGDGTMNDMHDNMHLPELWILEANSNVAYELFGKLMKKNVLKNE